MQREDEGEGDKGNVEMWLLSKGGNMVWRMGNAKGIDKGEREGYKAVREGEMGKHKRTTEKLYIAMGKSEGAKMGKEFIRKWWRKGKTKLSEVRGKGQWKQKSVRGGTKGNDLLVERGKEGKDRMIGIGLKDSANRR